MNFIKKRSYTVFIMLVLLFSFLVTGCSKKNTITVGSKDFSENIVLGEIISQLIENKTDLSVNRKLNMGGTFVCFEAIKNGNIDIYPEYTGTGLTAQLGMDVIADADETYQVVSEEFQNQFAITWLEPFGFNNTYTIAITNDVYEEYGIETYSDLAKYSENLVFGAEHEFFDRQDGFNGLVDLYDMNFKGEPQKMNVSLNYQAIGSGDIDVTDAFATDAQIMQYNLATPIDDKGFFPPYYAAPIVRTETLEKHPELANILTSLAGLIDDEIMTELNYKIDVEGQDIAAVAKDFLVSNNLLY